jgi:phosphopantothenoylcysteine decarboxylase/phosphopantothenate--cysteine ligase
MTKFEKPYLAVAESQPYMQLAGKKIILAVTGSIAAYKTPELVRQLVKSGAEVRVLVTQSAASFVSPLSLETVSKHPVYSSVSDGSQWNNHVEMGRWADVMLIAPCSANTLAKLANGLCDNLVCAVYLSTVCQVLVAPAMDEDMWHHPATKRNIAQLKSYGNIFIPVGYGELASGLTGEGRMAEPTDIVDFIASYLNKNTKQALAGKRALVTAGPTYERIDPVRFIGNFSSGKMGVAIAEELAASGAQVTLVLGPSAIEVKHPGVKVQRIESAGQMYDACTRVFPSIDIAVMSAAVADYKPANVSGVKIKKQDNTLDIQLEKTKDILAELGRQKKPGQYLVGFALETDNEEANALKKLESKNADMIVLNSLQDEGAGFAHDTNKVTLIGKDGTQKALPLMNKTEVAKAIVQYITENNYVETTV